jgi:hypothetical protein
MTSKFLAVPQADQLSIPAKDGDVLNIRHGG